MTLFLARGADKVRNLLLLCAQRPPVDLASVVSTAYFSHPESRSIRNNCSDNEQSATEVCSEPVQSRFRILRASLGKRGTRGPPSRGMKSRSTIAQHEPVECSLLVRLTGVASQECRPTGGRSILNPESLGMGLACDARSPNPDASNLQIRRTGSE